MKTTIIAMHEEFKVSEDEKKDAECKREREGFHEKAAVEIGAFIDKVLQPQVLEEEEKNRKFEEMLAQEGVEL